MCTRGGSLDLLMKIIGEICPIFQSSGGYFCQREGRGFGGSAWLCHKRRSCCHGAWQWWRADLTRDGKVRFQGKIYSQYRVFVTGEEKEFVEFELGVDTYSGLWASVITS